MKELEIVVMNCTCHEELAAKAGYKNRSSISQIEKSDELSLKKIEKLAVALNTSVAFLMGWLDDEYIAPEDRDDMTFLRDLAKQGELREMRQRYDNISPIEVHKYPILGEIACGKPIFANKENESYVKTGEKVNADFCLICKGDSMINARILNGDVVFIKEMSAVENGEIAAVAIGDSNPHTHYRILSIIHNRY